MGSMASETPPTDERDHADGVVAAVALGQRAEVILLRGAITGPAVDELRARLLAALERGVRELFLDLSEVERIDGIVYDLVSGASVALADRGGVLVVWSREDATGAATYVIADLRGRVLEELRARLSTNGP
jgi:anti-anti-sigma regulatory factor